VFGQLAAVSPARWLIAGWRWFPGEEQLMWVLLTARGALVDVLELLVPHQGVGFGYRSELAEHNDLARVMVLAVRLRVEGDDRPALSSGLRSREHSEHRDRRPAPRRSCTPDPEPPAVDPVPAKGDGPEDCQHRRPADDPPERAPPGHMRRDDACGSEHHQPGTEGHDGPADNTGQSRAVDWHRRGGRRE
jgi:hypothetical protein